MQKTTPNLWFEDQAEQAARFYISIFNNSKLGKFTYYSKDGHEIHGQKEGAVMTVEFQIEGQEFVALNGGLISRFPGGVQDHATRLQREGFNIETNRDTKRVKN